MVPRPGALLVLLAFPLFAQQQPAHTETIEIRLIEIDAVVTDRDGNPVAGLGPEDFELFENGRRQAITNFSEFRESDEPPSDTARPTTVARAEPRTIVLFFDTLQLRGWRREKLFGQVESLIHRVLRDGDRAQVLVWHDVTGVRAVGPLTSSRTALLEAITRVATSLDAPSGEGITAAERREFFEQRAAFAAARGAPTDPREAEASLLQAHEDLLSIMRRKTAAMQRIVSSLAERRGRTAFVYVSERFPLIVGKTSFGPDIPHLNTRPMLEAIVRSANAQGVVFYGLRPQVPGPGISASAQEPEDPSASQAVFQNELDALALVASGTGGSVETGPAGIDQAVERIARDLSSYYTLAYRAGSDGNDRERRIEIRAKNRDHIVHARKSIVDRSDRSRARDILIARLFEKEAYEDIEFDIRVGKGFPAPRSRVLVPIELTIPAEQLTFAEEGGELAAKFTVLVVAGANIGQVTKITDDSHRVTAPIGTSPEGRVTYNFQVLADRQPTTVSIAVFDENSSLAGVQSLTLEGGRAVVEIASADPTADASWAEAVRTAYRERKPLFVWFRPNRCRPCAQFEREVVAHPAIQRRLAAVVFTTQTPKAGGPAKQWASGDSGFALFDPAGQLRVKWIGTPDTTTFGALLDGAIATAPYFHAAVEAGDEEGELHAAIGLAMLGRSDEARKAVDEALGSTSAQTRQRAAITGAILEAREGNATRAIEGLHAAIAEAATPEIAGDAWLTLGTLHRHAGENAAAVEALGQAIKLVPADSPIAAMAREVLAAVRSAGDTGEPRTITIVPLEQQVVSGPHKIRTTVASADVDRVAFVVDGQAVREIRQAPFATTIDFGRVPERHVLRVVARDEKGNDIGADELVLNEGGETFWLRMLEPDEGPAGGGVAVSLRMRIPPARKVQRVDLTWNDSSRTSLTAPPWTAVVDIPAGELGVLRAVAHLDDGRTAEDAVLLNARGAIEHANVQLVEIPITVTARGDAPALTPSDVVVRENGIRRTVETLSADAPVTIGLLIDISGSMQKTLPDVQEAAVRFLETTLRKGDRAFVVAFNTQAELIQPATTDIALLRQRIMNLRPSGLTALHDAIALGLLQFEGVKGRRALVVFSDGIDRTSRYKASAITELAKRIHVPIHLIAATPPQLDVVSRPYRDIAGLKRMAESSGGSMQMLRNFADLPRFYAEIESAVESQLLVFVRTEPGSREAEWRPIEVEIEGGRASVRAPEGYYAPW